MRCRFRKTYPVQDNQIHAHDKSLGPKMNPLGSVSQKLVIKGLYPESIAALYE